VLKYSSGRRLPSGTAEFSVVTYEIDMYSVPRFKTWRETMCKLCVGSGTLNKAPELPSRRAALGMMSALSLLGMSAVAGGVHAKSPPRPENVLSPEEAVKRLIEGNERYTSGKTNSRSFASTRAALAGGQNPYASILGCADSRVSPELCLTKKEVTCSWRAWQATM